MAVPVGWVWLLGYDYQADSMIDPTPSFEAANPSLKSLVESMENSTGLPGTDGALLFDSAAAQAHKYLVGSWMFGGAIASSGLAAEAKSYASGVAAQFYLKPAAVKTTLMSFSAGPGFKAEWTYVGGQPIDASGSWPAPKGAKIQHVDYTIAAPNETYFLDFETEASSSTAYGPIFDQIARTFTPLPANG